MSDDYTPEEAARRRDEVIRRMANTPPQPRANRPAKGQGKPSVPGQPSQRPDAQKD